MRVLIDTNILISAVLNPGGTPNRAYRKAVTYPNHAMLCEQNVDEMRRIYNRKFPDKIDVFERFLSMMLMTVEIVPVPVEENISEREIRDVKDRPILRAAINAGADVLLTGDKDFLESGITYPAILTAAQFLEY